MWGHSLPSLCLGLEPGFKVGEWAFRGPLGCFADESIASGHTILRGKARNSFLPGAARPLPHPLQFSLRPLSVAKPILIVRITLSPD